MSIRQPEKWTIMSKKVGGKKDMDTNQRAFAGAVGGIAGTLALSGFRKVLTKFGPVFETVPMQIMDRMEELGLLEGCSEATRQALSLVAHLGYGIGTGTVLGLLRHERDGPATELAVGTSLGILTWGLGWAIWLPLLGVHRAPWNQRTAKVLLPILDHGVYGTVWGITNWALIQEQQ